MDAVCMHVTHVLHTYCILLFALILHLYRACVQISRCGIHAAYTPLDMRITRVHVCSVYAQHTCSAIHISVRVGLAVRLYVFITIFTHVQTLYLCRERN